MKQDKNTSSPGNEHDSNSGNINEPLSNSKDMQTITDLLGSYKGSPFDSNFSEKVLQAIENESVLRNKPARILPLFPASVLKIAASVFLVVAAGYFFWNQPKTYHSDLGTMSSVTFPDGSTVLLNSGSSVTFKPFTGKQTRSVHLHGEGYFDIQTSEKPFIVETFNAEIQVLGTKFSVTSWPDELTKQTAITLEEGKISVTASEAPQVSRVMLPQQSLIVFADAAISETEDLSENKTKNMLSWRQGGYVFQAMPLGAITQDLQRRGNLSITVPDALIDVPITYIEPTPKTVQQVIEDLSQAYSFYYSKTANGFNLSPTPDQE